MAPVVNAGPSVGGAWGQPITLNGSAVAGGTSEQPYLTFSWDFGDGSPSASGGASVSHSYSQPGTYTATLQSCDPLGNCGSASAAVTVRKRNVTAAYLGATTGTFDTPATLSASLTDEFGQAVSGRTVTFKVGSTTVGTSTTGPTGMASLGYTPGLPAGPYATEVSFAGDGLYAAASASGSITIVPTATSVTYTGALSGLPNKTVTLSATLKDASGTALSGKIITFALGSQTVTAPTDPTGVATTTLQLGQKNGTYSLTATYAPTGSDSGDYIGSAASTSFTIGNTKK